MDDKIVFTDEDGREWTQAELDTLEVKAELQAERDEEETIGPETL
jgi:hypothetical protein